MQSAEKAISQTSARTEQQQSQQQQHEDGRLAEIPSSASLPTKLTTVSISDFIFIKVLGKGSFGKVRCYKKRQKKKTEEPVL
ncbi:unnamed protein product [Gongylonema pulchrum]|uniref:Protein kinase domain-containing protein n=1 Tax=Gongylonema pulchrum TaxID=637853 RepID=A0A183ENS8_9BILA|nr:unnamed protein product [Gongylonema pulchrum]